MLSGLMVISEVRHLFPLSKACFLPADSSHMCVKIQSEKGYIHTQNAKCKMAFDSVQSDNGEIQSSVFSAGCQE